MSDTYTTPPADPMSSEPLVTVASITAGVAAIIALLVSFGVPVTPEQQTAILGVVAVVAPIIVAIVARGSVTPNARVVESVTPAGVVEAGVANELPTGKYVRRLGDGAADSDDAVLGLDDTEGESD